MRNGNGNAGGQDFLRGAKNGKNGRHRVFIIIFLLDKP